MSVTELRIKNTGEFAFTMGFGMVGFALVLYFLGGADRSSLDQIPALSALMFLGICYSYLGRLARETGRAIKEFDERIAQLERRLAEQGQSPGP